MDLVDDAGGGDVENARGAGDGGGDGVVVKEVDLEELEAKVGAFKG